MARSLEDIDELEVLEAQREVDFDNIIDDLFSNESSGLHVFFHRNERNSAFISKLIGFEHELDRQHIFEACRDEEDFVDGKKVIDALLVLFRSMGETITAEGTAIFDEAHLSQEQFMSNIQRAFVRITKMFEDSHFAAETYFLERLSSAHVALSGSLPKIKSVPPEAVLDIQPKSGPASQQAPLRSPGGKLITLSFDRQAAIHEMLRDVGLSVTLESIHEDEFVRATIPEILRVAELALRRTSRAIVRRTKPRDLDDLIDKTSKEIISNLQNQATDHPEMLVSKIIFHFYGPGREHLQSELERKIRQEVTNYFKKIHVTPATIAPPRTVTKRPSYRPRPPSQPPQPAVVVSTQGRMDVPTEQETIKKTERPPNFEPDALLISESIRDRVKVEAVPDDGGDADMGKAEVKKAPTATSLLAASIADEDTAVEAPSPELLAKSVPPAPMPSSEDLRPAPEAAPVPAPEIQPVPQAASVNTASVKMSLLKNLYEDDDKGKEDGEKTDQYIVPADLRPFRSVPDRAPVAKVTTPLARPIEEMPLPPASKEITQQPIHQQPPLVQQQPKKPVAPQKKPRPQHTPAPVPAPAPKKSGFFSKAKRWIVGGAMAAAAAMGVYVVTQSKNTGVNDETAPVASSSVATNNNPSASSTETPVPVASAAQTGQPQISTQPDTPIETPKVAAVLTSHSYNLSSASGATAFTGTASMVEGGVDATPFAPSAKVASWYQHQQQSAELLLKIYDSNKSRLDKDAVNFIDTHEKMLRELASQTDFSPWRFRSGFESHYSSGDIFGAKGVYNTLLAFERVLDLYGGDAEKLSKDAAIIKLTFGGKVLAPEQRFAKAVLFEAAPAPTPLNNKGVPGNQIDPAPQQDPQPSKGKSGSNIVTPGTNVPGNVMPPDIFQDDHRKAYAVSTPWNMTVQEMDEVDNGWDTIAAEHAKTAEKKAALRAELNGKVEKLFAKGKAMEAERAKTAAEKKTALRAELNGKMEKLFAKGRAMETERAKAPAAKKIPWHMSAEQMNEIDRGWDDSTEAEIELDESDFIEVVHHAPGEKV